jgi:hypothetical protein
MFSLFKSINSVFCDFSSTFNPTIPTKYTDVFGLRWPDDFEINKFIKSSHFQLINDFKTGLSFFNHEGTLFPHSKKIILERHFKIKECFIKERYADQTLPFNEDNVFLFETGYNSGNVEFIMFDLDNDFNSLINSFQGFRKVLYGFPFLFFLDEVCKIEETRIRKALNYNKIEQIENDLIINRMNQEGWQFMERDTSPSKDEYVEIVELPLQNYYFTKDETVHIWIEIAFF